MFLQPWKLITGPQTPSGDCQAGPQAHYPADPDTGLEPANLITGSRELSSNSDTRGQAGADPGAGQGTARAIWVAPRKVPPGPGTPRAPRWFRWAPRGSAGPERGAAPCAGAPGRCPGRERRGRAGGWGPLPEARRLEDPRRGELCAGGVRKLCSQPSLCTRKHTGPLSLPLGARGSASPRASLGHRCQRSERVRFPVCFPASSGSSVHDAAPRALCPGHRSLAPPDGLQGPHLALTRPFSLLSARSGPLRPDEQVP